MAQEGWNAEASSDSIDQCQHQQNQNQNKDCVLLHCSNNCAVFGISDASMNLCSNCFSERQGGSVSPPFLPPDLASTAIRSKDLPSTCSEKSCVASSAKKLGVVSLASKEASKDKYLASSKKRPLPSDDFAFDSVNSENVERSMKTSVLSAEAKDKSDMVCVLNSHDSSAFIDFTQASYLRTIDCTAHPSSSDIDALQRVLPSPSRKISSSSSLSCDMAGSDGACVASVIASEGSSIVDPCSPISRLDRKTVNCSDHRVVKRCFICKKRAGLLGFKCRCGDIFCALHRHSVKHNCPFDYKAAAKVAIAKANPLVRASKIQRI